MADPVRILFYAGGTLQWRGIAAPADSLNLPEDHLAMEEVVLARLREFTVEADPVTIRLDGMPVALAVAVTNALTLCGRIYDRLELNGCHLPFSRLHYLSEKPGLTLPQPMRERFDRINCELIRHTVTPEVYLNPDLRICRIDQTELSMTDDELGFYWLLLLRAGNQLPPVRGLEFLIDEFQAFLDSTASYVMPGVTVLRHTPVTGVRIREIMDRVTDKITAAVPFAAGQFFCLPEPMPETFGVMLNPERVNCPRNY